MSETSSVLSAETLIRRNHELLATAGAARHLSKCLTRQTQITRQFSEHLILKGKRRRATTTALIDAVTMGADRLW